ncbi:MAG: FAD-dependent oxidoreductase [Deltaproteobacteria bacterium]|nr:FAD-dependent oxidoreductase [Deltaproteobacteria bacterium]
MTTQRMHIGMCLGTSCIASGAIEVRDALLRELAKNGLKDKVDIVQTGCNGFCANGPIMVVYPGGFFYQKLCAADMAELTQEHLLKGRPVERLMFRHPKTHQVIPLFKDIPFFARQELRVLANKGHIAAERIEEYIGREGYEGAARALTEMSPEAIIAEVEKAGLRGRGGAGFPTAIKWKLCRAAAGDRKFILCNADEGDPGAFMDRSVLESDPHAVIEGMIIAAKAIGAREGWVYCRAEYPLALERLRTAIAQCHEYGLLGERILGTDFCLDIRVAEGSGAFVCGEETALMRSIEGKRGEPRPRPPFPADRGLWDRPSVLNNVETFANVPLILRHGADWFRSVGTRTNPGTKIFALTGKVNNIGLVEVPMGMSLGEIVFDIGGGIPNGKQFKAAQIGGPSGGCIPLSHLDIPVDYESLTEIGAIMGSGGLIVMDEDSCMVDMARFFLEFTQEESCGKCPPCRIGTKRMLEIVTRICEGQGEEGDIERLIELGETIKDTALCGLGQTAPNPVLSTIRHFRHEYEAHIRDKRCPAGVCTALVRAPCQNACPAGVDVPGYVSLIGEKRYAEALALHRNRNPLPGVCSRVCFHPCEGKCRRHTLDEAVSVRGLKRFMADQEVVTQLPEIRESAANAARKVAIVGAGPAGLACAYFLARLGYRPDVFEAESQPGGMLVQAIPAYRLPREVLAREVGMIERLGVDIRTGRRLGRDFSLESLRADGYQAVFLGLGCCQGTRLGIPGEDGPGVCEAIDFLRGFNLEGAREVGRSVAVIGGGNAAVDAARTALRLGAKEVTVLYRRSQDQMPAFAEEVEAASEEGVVFEMLVAPLEILRDGDELRGVKCQRMQLGGFDRSGRKRPVAVEGSQFEIAVDQVIAAIGQQLAGADCVSELRRSRRDFLLADPMTGQTSAPWIFAGGDACTGPASVPEAVAGGERAAVGIDLHLSGKAHAFWREDAQPDTLFDPEADPVAYPRAACRCIPADRRQGNFKEVEGVMSEAEALREAKRCLRCDYRE